MASHNALLIKVIRHLRFFDMFRTFELLETIIEGGYRYRFLNQLGRSNFLKYIQEFDPDLIVCTYPTVSSILAQLRLEHIL